MKNIWKNAIYLISLIGLMTFVSSCGSDDPDPGTGTDPVVIVFSADPDATEPAVVTSEFKLTASISTDASTVTVSGYDTSWPMPTGFENKEYTLTSFLALDWDTPPVINGTATEVVLTYTHTEAASSARPLETDTKYTYNFKK
ncbi:hypothetical protein [Flammeovirga aprica]|uniref:Uncharacterized protein n=1 Tax=Flammeovirga aprica JL-4 TaxID=694437 RepID=A0A7X9XAJ4_9BACT|nr:hypothetical protein [Flammeovirga aprica]NME69747.1 hypothetical protein [Flammeovirga aprica JL-4]